MFTMKRAYERYLMHPLSDSCSEHLENRYGADVYDEVLQLVHLASVLSEIFASVHTIISEIFNIANKVVVHTSPVIKNAGCAIHFLMWSLG